jgi:hypothetical protein
LHYVRLRLCEHDALADGSELEKHVTQLIKHRLSVQRCVFIVRFACAECRKHKWTSKGHPRHLREQHKREHK